MAETLNTEAWIPGIKENPIPDNSFVYASVDLSEYVDNNTLHLAEAGLDPEVYEDYFEGNENPLPVATIVDTPSEVVLKTYSTAQTRHRKLQDAELQYNRQESILKRHRKSLAKDFGRRASFEWTPSQDDNYNKIIDLGANGSIIDGLIDLEAFYGKHDIDGIVNICLDPDHLARIRKEDYKLYKAIKSEKGMDLYGMKIYGYSKNPIFTGAGLKKPLGSVLEAGDRRSSFTWVTDEVFRCHGDVEMYSKLGDPGLQADTISFAQRGLVGKIRAKSPKYLGAII